MFTLEYADGYYIAKDGEGVIDFANAEDRQFAQQVCDALNAARPKHSEHPPCTCANAIGFIDHSDWIECVNCHGEQR